MFWRCTKHYRCDKCGTEDNLCYRTGGLWCDTCHQLRVDKVLRTFDGDTSNTDEITCPHCGYEVGDSWELPDSHDRVCNHCGNTYEYYREYTITYANEKVGETKYGVAN